MICREAMPPDKLWKFLGDTMTPVAQRFFHREKEKCVVTELLKKERTRLLIERMQAREKHSEQNQVARNILASIGWDNAEYF